MTLVNVTDAEYVEYLVGEMLYRPHYDRIITRSETLVKPDGRVLLIYVCDGLSPEMCRLAWQCFGDLPLGSESRTMGRAAHHSETGTIGYLDRAVPASRSGPRLCRMTALTRDYFDFEEAMPFIHSVDALYRRYAPDYWAAQRAFIKRVHPDWRLGDSVFTSIQVNRNVRCPAHRDTGNFRVGLGVMLALEHGQYFGGELIFPRYRVAVDMRNGGVLFADVGELHGNAPIVGETRLSLVLYARRGMAKCGSFEDELRRAKQDRSCSQER